MECGVVDVCEENENGEGTDQEPKKLREKKSPKSSLGQ